VKVDKKNRYEHITHLTKQVKINLVTVPYNGTNELQQTEPHRATNLTSYFEVEREHVYNVSILPDKNIIKKK
jgi:hypothetical protein